MKVGICLPYMKQECDRKQLLSWFQRLDQGPFSTLSCGERIIGGAMDMRILIAAAAAVTERIQLMPTLYVLPMHPAVRAAKEIATLDILAGGRLRVAIGVGGRETDFQAVDMPFDDRHRRMDEKVSEMQQIWRGEAIAVTNEEIGPRPLQQGGPPLFIGAMSEKGMRHGAQWAEGLYVFSMNGEEQETRLMLEMSERIWAESNTSRSPYKIGGFWYSLAPHGKERLEQYVFEYLRIADEKMARSIAQKMSRNTPEAVREGIDNLLAAGCDEIFLSPATAEYQEIHAIEEILAHY